MSYPLGTNENRIFPRGSAKAAVHLPVESASTALQSVSPGNSRVVHDGFGAPAGKFMRFIRGAKSRAYYLEYLFSDGEEAKGYNIIS
ncbi:MAG: hypothetical protein LBJ90_02445, partial [Treponema sp.]|jgi:hypothetical protein|nr:hypothetical protein [Treponema sp.]